LQGNYGGIMHVINAVPFFKNVDFDYGQTHNASGIAVRENGKLVLVNCTVSRSQSAGEGSALSLLDASARLLMIGGKLHLNWDAGGVFYMSAGQALLVNTVIEGNHENPVQLAGGTAFFVNSSITGNFGTTGSDANQTITTSGTSAVHFYNSVVRYNLLQTYGTNIWFNQTVAPNLSGSSVTRHGTSLPLSQPLPNQGINTHYPLDTTYSWRDTYPGESVMDDITDAVAPAVAVEILEALKKDGYGNPRYTGTIDLGAAEL
jgi:hypothetical protein